MKNFKKILSINLVIIFTWLLIISFVPISTAGDRLGRLNISNDIVSTLSLFRDEFSKQTRIFELQLQEMKKQTQLMRKQTKFLKK